MENQKKQYNTLKDVPAFVWEKLANKKIFFGHQSVGYNILNGITELMKKYTEIKLNIVEISDKINFIAGVFAHSRVGYNRDPKSKVDGFKTLMDKGLGEKMDIAFLKFCYVDFNHQTDVKKVFTEYSDAISTLKKKYPATTFIHVTAPLVKKQTGLKILVKKIMGNTMHGNNDNAAKCKFNELIKQEYKRIDPVFDLAKVESKHPDGKREFFKKDGNTYYALVPHYTNDGGHLNSAGQKAVASELLLFLAANV